MAAAKVYAEQLFRLGHGYPLWNPEPTKHGEVLVGDVGFVMDGAFYRLFNATLPSEDKVNEEFGVPDGFKPFVPPKYGQDAQPGYLASGPLCSRSIRQTTASGHVSASNARAGFHFQCTDEQGAVLVLAEGADREVLLPSRRMANYMKHNYQSWYAFATSEKVDVALAKEDIIFIRGYVKTKDWAVVAFIHEGRSAQLTLNGDFASVGSAAFSVEHTTDVTVAPEKNWGPKGRQHKRNKRHGKQPITKDSDKVDQCIFLHYYKLKVRLGFWPTIMKAAAGPHELPRGPDEDNNGGRASVALTDDMEDVVVEEVPARQKVFDPVDTVLDYILKYSEANAAIANDEDIVELCKHHGVDIPDDIPSFLEDLQPLIEINEDGLGMLSHETMPFEEGAEGTEEAVQPAEHPEVPPEHQPNHATSLSARLDDRPEDKTVDDDASRGDGLSIVLDEHTGGVCALACSPDGRVAASGSEDSTVILWDINEGKRLRICAEHRDTISSLAFSPTGAEIVSGSCDGNAIIWNVGTGESRTSLDGHGGFVYSVAWSPNGQTIATASVDFSVKLWEASTGLLRRSLDGHNAIVMLVVFSPNSKRIVSASADYSAHVWDVETGQQLADLRGHTGVIYSISFSHDSRRILTGSDDGTARIWSAQTGDLYVVLQEHTGSVWVAIFSPDGTKVLSAASDGTVKICDSFTGDSLLSVDTGDPPVNAAAFSPNGARICASAGDNSIRVWDAITGQLLLDLPGHTDKVSHLKFSQDGDTIVSSSEDSTLRVWHLTPLLPAPEAPAEEAPNHEIMTM